MTGSSSSPLSPAMREALERVPDEWTPWSLVPVDILTGAALHARRLIAGRTERLYGARVEKVRRTPAGRAALEDGNHG